MDNFDLLSHVQIILHYTAVKFNYLQRQNAGYTKTSKRVVYYKMITSAVQKGYVQFFVPLVQEHLLQACTTAANRSTPIFTPGTQQQARVQENMQFMMSISIAISPLV